MAKKYLEIIEQLTDEESLIKQAQEMRLEVDSKEEALTLLSTYESLFDGLNYIKRLHTYYHEEGLPCTSEEL